jgi:hypothetical protein
MPILPFPSTRSLQDFGGALNDYKFPALDPKTDRTAAGANAFLCATAQLTHLQPRWWAQITWSSAVSLYTVVAWDAPYRSARPVLDVPPAVTRNGGTGKFLITWPAIVHDELGNVQTFTVRAAWTSSSYVTATPSANTVALYLWDLTAGPALSDLTSGQPPFHIFGI